MAMAKHFSNKLDELWRRRTASLRALVIPRGAGAPPKFSRSVRERLIEDLLADSTKILLAREGKAALKAVTASHHLKHIKGHGLLKRGKNLLGWAKAALHGPIVYAFWRGKKCLYVGKGASWKRLKSYEKSVYLMHSGSIEVFCITTKGQLGKAECLATHLFEPRDKKVKPAKVKWGKACPICRKHDLVRTELTALFKIK
jgi:hypothetical protein